MVVINKLVVVFNDKIWPDEPQLSYEKPTKINIHKNFKH